MGVCAVRIAIKSLGFSYETAIDIMDSMMARHRGAIYRTSALVLATLVLSRVCFSNPLDPTDFVMGVLVIPFLYEVAVTFIEAGLYWTVLKISFPRSLWYSAICNVLSVLVGFFTFHRDFGGFLVALLVEIPVLVLLIKGYNSAKRTNISLRRAAFAGLAANVITFSLTFFLRSQLIR